MAAPKRVYTSSGGTKSTAHDSTNRGLFEFGMTLLDRTDAVGCCPICFDFMGMNGATNEHILTPTEYQAIFGSAMAEGDYNADWNIMQAHARCNASKGTRGIFATWSAAKPTGLSPEQYEILLAVLKYYAGRGKSSIGHFAKGTYKSKLQYIVSVVTSRNLSQVRFFMEV